MLRIIKRMISYKMPEIMVRLYKTLVRPHLEYCVNVWSSHCTKDKELLELGTGIYSDDKGGLR